MPEVPGSLDILSQAVEQNPHAILITNLSGNIVYVNRRFRALTGYSFEEIVGKNPRVLSSGKTDPEIYRKLWATVLAGEIWQGELLNRRKNGQFFWESISISPVKDGEGRVTHFVGVWNDSTERKKNEERTAESLKEFERQSITDDLTGQYNRRYILLELEKEVARAKRYGRKLSGMMIDIDDFKAINDRHGHLMGDRVIRAFAGIIRKSIRKIDLSGRYGGDEFLVLLPEATMETAKRVAERIRENLRIYEQNVLSDFGKLTASIGLMSFEDMPEADQTTFIERIDGALIQSKRAGKNTITAG